MGGGWTNNKKVIEVGKVGRYILSSDLGNDLSIICTICDVSSLSFYFIPIDSSSGHVLTNHTHPFGLLENSFLF